MEITTLLWLIPVIGLASFVQGTVGFAFGMISMGLGTILLDAQTASVIVAPLATANIALVLWSVRSDVSWRNTGSMIAGLVVGLPLGLAVLLHGNIDVLTVLIAALLFYTGIRKLVVSDAGGKPLSSWWGVAAGVVGGVLGGAANISGPPLIAYSTRQNWSPGVFKASLLGTFLIGSTLKTSVLIVEGSLRGSLLIAAALLCPVVYVGSFCGIQLFNRVNRDAFGKIVAVMVILLGVWLISSKYITSFFQELVS